MSMQDPLSDMLTRIRNAQLAGHEEVRMPSAKLKGAVAKVLTEEGYIDGFSVDEESGKPEMTLRLKYFEGKPVIQSLQRISKPSRRVYVGVDELPVVSGGLGVAIMSTPRGVVTGRTAYKEGVGGEVICTVF